MREPGRRQHSEKQESGGHKPTALQAVVATLRSVPERLKRPESLLMVLAIMASMGAHMPPYLGLGALAEYFTEQEKRKPKPELPPVSIDIVEDKSAEPTPPVPDQPEPTVKLPKPKPEKKQPKQKPEPEPPKEEAKKEVVELTPQQSAQALPPEPPKEARKQSITQKSEDPNVEPPPDAKYLAEESQRVEEESVASVTSETKNDPTLQESAPQAPGDEKSGDSREDERGAEQGSKTEQAQRSASRELRQQAVPRPPSAQQQPEPPSSQAPARPAQPAPAPSQPRAEAPPETVIRDPLGSFVLAPSNPNAPRPSAQQPSGAPGRQSNIKVSWSAFEQTFGAEQLAQDRMPREAKRRGAGREKRWEEFRASIENYVVGVKPGNQTRLNAAADPFAAYLAAFHRNLHLEFAHDFLSSLPASGELANPDLVTTVEIVINADGSLDRVGVVRPSGSLMYDFGAFNAVQRGAPYPPTPEKIRSPDGRVYIKWALHHNESQCGTWNAEAFILKNPPRSPNDPKQDNVSPFRPASSGDNEHGGSSDPKRSPPGKAPAIEPGSTLGLRKRRTVAIG